MGFNYIKIDIEGNYVSFDFELDGNYKVGSTWQDYLDGKFVPLTDEQLRFKEENPTAGVDEVFNMSLNEAQITEEDALFLAKREKRKELQDRVNELYKYYVDGNDVFVYNRLYLKDRCSRYDTVSLNNIEFDSDSAAYILDDMSDYVDMIDPIIEGRFKAIDDAETIEEVEGIDVATGYPDVIETTSDSVAESAEERSANDEEKSTVTLVKSLINTLSVPAATALDVKVLYPVWGESGAEIGTSVDTGFRCRTTDDGKDILWEAIQSFTLQEDWKPGVETASLWMALDEVHVGTVDDPIPYVPPMILYYNKIYIENGVKYLCIRDSGIALTHNLKDLLGTYTALIEEA